MPGLVDLRSGAAAAARDLARRDRRDASCSARSGSSFDPRTREPIFFDSAFPLDARGRVRLERYDKTHLVPFGEYVPLRGVIGFFLRAVARGMAPRQRDGRRRVRGLSRCPGPAARASPSLTMAVPICYELLFPDLVRRMVDDGAEALLAITNDAWYGRTGAPYQFLAITAMRSAETRVWTARAANTGVSAIIDSRGRVRQREPGSSSGACWSRTCRCVRRHRGLVLHAPRRRLRLRRAGSLRRRSRRDRLDSALRRGAAKREESTE